MLLLIFLLHHETWGYPALIDPRNFAQSNLSPNSETWEYVKVWENVICSHIWLISPWSSNEEKSSFYWSLKLCPHLTVLPPDREICNSAMLSKTVDALCMENICFIFPNLKLVWSLKVTSGTFADRLPAEKRQCGQFSTAFLSLVITKWCASSVLRVMMAPCIISLHWLRSWLT